MAWRAGPQRANTSGGKASWRIDTLYIIEIKDTGPLWGTKHYLQVLEWRNETMRGNSHRKRNADKLKL